MVYKKIVSLCEEKGISIARLEKEIGLGNGTVARWASSSPSVDNAKKVADFFGVTLDYLISND